MLNYLWLFLILAGIVVAAINGNIEQVSTIIFKSTTECVQLIIQLLGPMALWLGLLNIARKSGLINLLGKIIKPLFKFIFPDIPDNHPAAGSILLNISANILGLGNSATPLGIKAMQELQELNNNRVTASNAMCTLLAINTSSITILPATIISLRAATGSLHPSIILFSTIFATTISTITALVFDKVFRIVYRS